MSQQLHLTIVTPEKQIFEDKVDQVNISTSEGTLGILPNHANLMAKVIPGELIYKTGSKSQAMAVGEGFLQVHNNTLKVMTDLAVNAEHIDERAVEEAKKRAEKALEEKLSDEEYATTIAILDKSLAQLRVKRRHHH